MLFTKDIHVYFKNVFLLKLSTGDLQEFQEHAHNHKHLVTFPDIYNGHSQL